MFSKKEESAPDNQNSKNILNEFEDKFSPFKVGDLVQNRFLISHKIGQGSFGSVFKVNDQNNNNVTFAIKIQSEDDEKNLLEREIKVLIELRKQKGFPQIRFYGQERGQTYCIMQMLGQNLEQIFKKLGSVMKLGSVLRLGIQMIERIAIMHQSRFLHRDIKPDNFVIDGPGNPRLLYLIDFGLSKYYINKKGDHIVQAKKGGLIGTARYASVSAHEEIEQSRRDDLESIGYVLIYLAKGALPWMNLQIEKKDLKYAKIKQIKKEIKINELCQSLPICFEQFMTDVKSLEFKETPNYETLKSYFEKQIELDNKQQSNIQQPFVYDWERLSEFTKQKKHQTIHVMENQTKNQAIQIVVNLNKQNQMAKQDLFLNQQITNSQQNPVQIEQNKNEKKIEQQQDLTTPSNQLTSHPFAINVIENQKDYLQPIKLDESRITRIQNHSTTLLQNPQFNSSFQFDSFLQPSIATSRMNNYLESESVNSEGNVLPIWDINESQQEVKRTGILEGIRKPSQVILRRERKIHSQIDTLKQMQDLFVHPKQIDGDNETSVEGLE
ncbi:unnamed protein product (macronuclear) [Paramecium tetraurelia]|uniref:Casein kinase I n=1 Tax=Paramecium tetraurelia TaxID=5888 RepID=A0C4T1_PARTE|nr:uncharacterized protein GSPATT00006297001 [Paramecium tetraurelia]CAK65798.1 unnamed protein product [Paramecium tetraurelia]|eukprot:XP_001433195.1 hypothetical protein (macronuclear) [Paramecium tetraurelia strain d4-2]